MIVSAALPVAALRGADAGGAVCPGLVAVLSCPGLVGFGLRLLLLFIIFIIYLSIIYYLYIYIFIIIIKARRRGGGFALVAACGAENDGVRACWKMRGPLRRVS